MLAVHRKGGREAKRKKEKEREEERASTHAPRFAGVLNERIDVDGEGGFRPFTVVSSVTWARAPQVLYTAGHRHNSFRWFPSAPGLAVGRHDTLRFFSPCKDEDALSPPEPAIIPTHCCGISKQSVWCDAAYGGFVSSSSDGEWCDVCQPTDNSPRGVGCMVY